jgi:hypothetical protein
MYPHYTTNVRQCCVEGEVRVKEECHASGCALLPLGGGESGVICERGSEQERGVRAHERVPDERERERWSVPFLL